jgi:hypothetical protein
LSVRLRCAVYDDDRYLVGTRGVFSSAVAACHANVAMTMADYFAPSRGAGYLAKRDGLAAWGCRRESQLEHHALSRRVAGERSRDIR